MFNAAADDVAPALPSISAEGLCCVYFGDDAALDFNDGQSNPVISWPSWTFHSKIASEEPGGLLSWVNLYLSWRCWVPVCVHIVEPYTLNMLSRFKDVPFFVPHFFWKLANLLNLPLILSACTTPCVIWLRFEGLPLVQLCQSPWMCGLCVCVCVSKCHLTGQNGTLLSRQKNFSLLLCRPWKNAIFSWITSYKRPLQFNHSAAGWSRRLCQFSFL